jgi:tetratricopeptide (TPR) repeat protein
LLLPLGLAAQIKPIAPKGTTRAVVVGISNYQNEQISDLRFADADAKAFAAYLQSDAGGRLPPDNLRLLTNEQATQGQLAAAFTWLADASQAGDKAIIYFSGHGDMETLTGLSFLLAHDASAAAYSGGGSFPVVFLQAIITRLSTQKQVQVLLVTDACRAGKLAGSEINGTQATAKILSDQFANEAKILSCQPNEFSLEGAQWGGGRGVFSYYLLDGLRGLADHNRDQSVTLLEIGRYLEDKVPAAAAPHTQIPMVVGNKAGVLALVDAPTLAALEGNTNPGGATEAALASRGPAAEPKDSVAQRWLQAFELALREQRLLGPSENAAYPLLKRLETRPAAADKIADLRLQLSAQLQDGAQTAINDYLAADPRELRRRWGFDNRYEKFPEYLEKAAELLGNEHFTYKRLQARAHYFRGLNLRLRGERSNQAALLAQAQAEQEKALALDPDAVFALNETGHLLLSLGKSREAVAYFERALALSPRWVLPWSNRCFAHIELDEYDQAEQCGLKAIGLDSTFVMALYNLALCYQLTGRYAEAANYYHKTLRHDAGYLKAHFNLGLTYYFLGDYQKSEQAFLEYQRREPNDPVIYQNLGEVARKLGDPARAEREFQKALAIAPKHPGAHLSLAELHTALGQAAPVTAQAEAHFRQAEEYLLVYVQLEKEDAEGQYQLAGVQAQLNKAPEALERLEKAFQLGFRDRARLGKDTLLQPLSGMEAFRALLKGK